MNFYKADKSQMEACSRVLKSAFAGYPFFEIYTGKPPHKQEFFERMMDLWLKSCFEKGRVLVAEDDGVITGVAVLQGPHDDDIEIIDVHGPDVEKLTALADPQTVSDFIHMCDISDAACQSLAGEKWYLVLLAVSDEVKGQGIGSRMLRDGILPYIAKEGGGLFTFNTNDGGNRNFYTRQGFEEFDESYLHEKGVVMGNWSYRKNIAPL